MVPVGLMTRASVHDTSKYRKDVHFLSHNDTCKKIQRQYLEMGCLEDPE